MKTTKEIQTSHTTEEEKKPKPRGKYYCVEAEKRFPKIRIAQSDYDRIKLIQQQFNYKSLGQVINRLLNTYNKYYNQSKKETHQNQNRFTLSKKLHAFIQQN